MKADLIIIDSVTEAGADAAGRVVICGSHGGVSSGRYALKAAPRAVVFNDAGGGRDGAGIAALAMLQANGIAACAVAHTSARIGEAWSTLESGLIAQMNDAARTLGARVGMPCREWVRRLNVDA